MGPSAVVPRLHVTNASGVRSWDNYIERRPELLTPLEETLAHRVARGAMVIDYFWFLFGSPQPFDRYQEANRRAQPLLVARERPTFTPDTIPSDEVGYYSNPIDRLSRMHLGENDMTTGFGVPAAWPAPPR